MEIIGEQIILTEQEIESTGYSSPIPIRDLEVLSDQVQEDRDELMARKSSDDLSKVSGAMIPESEARLLNRAILIKNIKAALFLNQDVTLEEELDRYTSLGN